MHRPDTPISVLGGGSWGTALVKMLAHNNARVYWWVRKPETATYIRKHHHNPDYLTDVEIDTHTVHVTDDLAHAVGTADAVILAVPSPFLKDTLKPLGRTAFNDKTVFSAIKGIIPDDLVIVGDFIKDSYSVTVDRIGVITGPCHAEEVALEKLSYLTIACPDTVLAGWLAERLACRYLKTIVSDDIYGTEYAAVLKNVVAIACGICHGIGYGDNFQAVLVATAIREIKRFVDAVHPINRDINDSAYLGDLLVTAYSQFSRNRLFGSMVGKGYSVRSAQLEMNMIAEGYYAVKCIHELNKKYKVDLPICDAVYNVLYEKIAPKMEMRLLSDKLS